MIITNVSLISRKLPLIFTDFTDFLCLCNYVVAIYTDFYKTKGLIYP